MATRFRSGTPVFACAADLSIVVWNDAAAELTGIPPEEALGQPCWSVIGGRDDDGSLVCHRACSRARLAREGWPLTSQTLTIKAREGRSRVGVETVTSTDPFLMLHVMHDAPARGERPRQAPTGLTERQHDVLKLLDEGLSAREISRRLSLTESTIRNHIRAILAELRAHSQLEAVSKAHRAGVL
jgi:DNA-binding CsgD family transcriptional regulator